MPQIISHALIVIGVHWTLCVCSGKLRSFESYFFLRWQSDQRKLLLAH